ncbi:MAG: OmpA family protein [Bacteroidota bacterium]
MRFRITHLIIVALIFGLSGQDLKAQSSAHPWGIGVGYVFRDFEKLPNGLSNDIDFEPAFNVSVGRYIGKYLDLGLQTGIPIPDATSRTNPIDLKDLMDFELLGRFKLANGDFSQPRVALQPFLQAGIGGGRGVGGRLEANEPGNFVPIVPLGGGLRLMLGGDASLDFQANYKMFLSSAANLDDYVTLGMSANFAFGRGKQAPEPEPEPEPVDTDGDGIVDTNDLCPEEAGLAQFNGCPDRDKDGVPDKDDECPDEPGIVTLKGCPEKVDTDNDGIIDEEDACPTVVGVAAFKGCPDTDADGIQDSEDECPEVAGIAEFNGCPDTDGDGIKDSEDKCPEEAGVAEMQGCPEVEEEVKEQLKNITKGVQFQSGKAVLLERSKLVLDEIVTIMEEYPAYSLRISGHTDSQGREDSNMTLSENRAKTCYYYLSDKGISVDRMVFEGFGESQPIADNNTATGRKENRRVNFELFVKE